MIYIRLGMVVAGALIVWLVIKLLRSPKFDKFCDNMVSGELDNESTSKDTIKDITTAEKDLGKQSDSKTKEAEKLTKESKGINEFLDNRGVSDVKKGEDS